MRSKWPALICDFSLDGLACHSYCGTVKNITVSVDEQTYHNARVEAAKRRKSLSALVAEFLVRLAKGEEGGQTSSANAELAKLFAMSDEQHKTRRGSAGPLNREELHRRGVSGH